MLQSRYSRPVSTRFRHFSTRPRPMPKPKRSIPPRFSMRASSPTCSPSHGRCRLSATRRRMAAHGLQAPDPPNSEENEKTFAEPKARTAKTAAYVKTLDPKKIDESADREITFPLGPENKGHMKGADYLNHFVLPNFYFHATTAYDILRHCGV